MGTVASCAPTPTAAPCVEPVRSVALARLQLSLLAQGSSRNAFHHTRLAPPAAGRTVVQIPRLTMWVQSIRAEYAPGDCFSDHRVVRHSPASARGPVCSPPTPLS